MKIFDPSGAIKKNAEKMARSLEKEFPDIFKKLTRKDREVLITKVRALILGSIYAVLLSSKDLTQKDFKRLHQLLKDHI